MARGRSLAEFQQEFPDEASCAAFLFKRRWPGGFVCPACGKSRAVALKSRPRLFEWSPTAGAKPRITAGTAMHRSKLPLATWFWTAHLMATHSNGMSARQFEDQLGVTYKTAWLLSQKLRQSMAYPNRDLLEGVVGVDQAEIPFRVATLFFEPGNAGKILIAGAIEVIERDTNKAKPRRKGAKYLDTRSGRLRLAIDRQQFGCVDRSLRECQCEARDDADHRWPRILPRTVRRLPARSARRWRDGGQYCPAMDTTAPFRPTKRWALGTYHGLRRKHVDTYLNEFVVSIQPPLLPACLVRNHARPRRAP